MCGRFTLLADLLKIVETFDIQEIDCEVHPSGNICPGEQVASVIHDGVNRLVEFQWGLIPSWAKDPAIGYNMINARAETIAEKPSFREAFKRHRCLIVADGFYEWKKDGKRKVPMQILLKSGEPFAFAGLYEHWRSPDRQVIKSCAIITKDANELIAPVHDRMPVILSQADRTAWIDPDSRDSRRLLSMLKPYPSDEMEIRAADPSNLKSISGSCCKKCNN